MSKEAQGGRLPYVGMGSSLQKSDLMHKPSQKGLGKGCFPTAELAFDTLRRSLRKEEEMETAEFALVSPAQEQQP